MSLAEEREIIPYHEIETVHAHPPVKAPETLVK